MHFHVPFYFCSLLILVWRVFVLRYLPYFPFPIWQSSSSICLPPNPLPSFQQIRYEMSAASSKSVILLEIKFIFLNPFAVIETSFLIHLSQRWQRICWPPSRTIRQWQQGHLHPEFAPISAKDKIHNSAMIANSQSLKDSFLIEAYNLNAAVEFCQEKVVNAKETMEMMPHRV